MIANHRPSFSARKQVIFGVQLLIISLHMIFAENGRVMTDFMQRIAKPQADPRLIPEHHLWTLTKKDGRRAEARTRVVPIGDGKPELRFYVFFHVARRERLDLAVVPECSTDGRQVGEESEAKKREFEAMGWMGLVHGLSRPQATCAASSRALGRAGEICLRAVFPRSFSARQTKSSFLVF